MALQSRSIEDFREDALVLLSRRLNTGWSKPDWVSVNLTLKCNLSCSFCKTCYPIREELSTREIKDIIDQTADWGVRRFNPIGGEPFVRRDLEEILAYACAKDFYITLTTNGTLISPERAALIAAIPPNRLHFNISVDGPEKWHDLGRGAGSFARAVKGYHNLREADRRAGNPLRKILINTIIHRRNLLELPAFLYWCRDELGAQGIQFLNLFRHGDGLDPETEALWIKPEQWRELDDLVDFLIGFVQHEGDEAFRLANDPSDLQNVKKYYRGELKPLDGACYSGWKELYINADGQAIMCDGQLDFLNGTFGDIRRQTLRQLWTGDEIARLRSSVKRCTTPCVQDCYLRSRSDSAVRIARGVGRLLFEQLKKKYSRPVTKVPQLAGTVLTLQLSDVLDLRTPWKAVPEQRFAALIRDAPGRWQEVLADPFAYHELRNSGALNFHRGFLDFALLKDVIEDAQRRGLRWSTVRLGWEGEPLLHPQAEEILAWLAARWVEQPFCDRIELLTGGVLLNDNHARITTQSAAPFRWIVQVDAHDAASYLASHDLDAWEAVLRNSRMLLAAVAAAPRTRTRLVLQDAITESTARDVLAFRDVWLAEFEAVGLKASLASQGLPQGDEHRLHFRRLDAQDAEQLRAHKERYTEALTLLGLDPREGAPTEVQERTCAAYWKTPTISWEGKVLLCTVDRQQLAKIGAIDTESLSEIWWFGQPIRQIREEARGGECRQLRHCGGCTQPHSPNSSMISQEEIELAAALKIC